MKFKGDIIITDPCYFIKDEDWHRCHYGKNMWMLGIKNYICGDTLYGDWSCTTFNVDINEIIGNFCADAGMVAVALLDEVLQYNPDFDYHINRKWTTTLIKDFDGEVEFEIIKDEDGYKELRVVGIGNINFVGLQTGL